MFGQSSHLAVLLGTASLSYDLAEFRVEASMGRGARQRAKRRHSSLRRDEHLPTADDDHLVQTFGSPSQISPACPTRSSSSLPHSRRRPATLLHLAFHPHSALANVLGACRLKILGRGLDDVGDRCRGSRCAESAPNEIANDRTSCPPRRRITPLNPCPLGIALSPAPGVCGS